MKNKIPSNAPTLFLASTVAFIFVPIFMIGQRPEDYTFIDLKILLKASLCYTIFYGILLNVINVFFIIFRQQKLSTLFSYFVLSWAALSGFLLPVSVRTVMVDPFNNPVDTYNLVFVLIFSGLFSILGVTAFKKFITVFILILVVTPLVYSANAIYGSDIVSSATIESKAVSVNKNIFVIGFDGMPGEVVNRIIKSNKKFSNELKDFVVFEQAISQSGSTDISLTGDIYGTKDYSTIAPNEKSSLNEVKEILNKEFANVRLPSKITDSYQFGYSGFEIEQLNLLAKQNKTSTTLSLFDYVIIRMFTNKGLTINNYIFSDLPILPYLVGTQLPNTNLYQKLQQHKGAEWDKPHILTFNAFDNFVSTISASKTDISLRYLHFSFTHFPIDFDAECNYRSDDKTWHRSNQNEIGVENEITCAISKFIDFLYKLKELKIYDKSLIVFKSDHGKFARFYTTPPNNLLFNDHHAIGYNRFRPALMIKSLSTSKPEITYKPDLVLLPDIARTLCEESKLDLECNKLIGVNLLSDSLGDSIPYYLFLDHPSLPYAFENVMSIKIPSRKISFYEALVKSKSINMREYRK